MRNYEEGYLRKTTDKIRSFARLHVALGDLYNHVGELSTPSMQDLSFERDMAFFYEVSKVTNVIASIEEKPHTLTKREETITREAPNGLTDEGYRKTLMDSSLWRSLGSEMRPEEVYYYQYYDEMVTYENVFVVSLLDLISVELDRYHAFYLSILRAMDYGSDRLSIDNDAQEVALGKLKSLLNKMDKLKSHRFYKVVSKAKGRHQSFNATNILVHDKLYNACYRFYKEMMEGDDESTQKDVELYYFVLLLKEMKRQGMWLDSKAAEAKCYQDKDLSFKGTLKFSNGDFSISVELLDGFGAYRFTILDKEDYATSSHVLLIDKADDFHAARMPDPSWEASSFDYLSIWHLSAYEDGKMQTPLTDLLSEKDLLKRFFEIHHTVIVGSKALYSTYCPVCRCQDIDCKDGIYECKGCHSVYRILPTGDKEAPNKVVFSTLRRK